MEFIWIARVIDGSNFDRVAFEAAFLDKASADAWAYAHYCECVEDEEPAFRTGWRQEIESVRLMK